MGNAARTRQRMLAIFLPIAAVLCKNAEALSPKGTDQVVTDTATALKLLAIAAKHPAQVYAAGTCAVLGPAGGHRLGLRASSMCWPAAKRDPGGCHGQQDHRGRKWQHVQDDDRTKGSLLLGDFQAENRTASQRGTARLRHNATPYEQRCSVDADEIGVLGSLAEPGCHQEPGGCAWCRVGRGGGEVGKDQDVAPQKAPMLPISAATMARAEPRSLLSVAIAVYETASAPSPGSRGVCPFFFRFRPGVRACRKKGRGQGGGPGWTNDLDAGLSSGSRWRGRERYGVVGSARPVRSSCPWAGSRLRSSLRVCPRLAAAGAWGGFACGQRDQSDSRPARRGAGASKTSDHALPAAGPAHAACRAAAARDRTWPSRMA